MGVYIPSARPFGGYGDVDVESSNCSRALFDQIRVRSLSIFTGKRPNPRKKGEEPYPSFRQDGLRV